MGHRDRMETLSKNWAAVLSTPIVAEEWKLHLWLLRLLITQVQSMCWFTKSLVSDIIVFGPRDLLHPIKCKIKKRKALFHYTEVAPIFMSDDLLFSFMYVIGLCGASGKRCFRVVPGLLFHLLLPHLHTGLPGEEAHVRPSVRQRFLPFLPLGWTSPTSLD